MRSRTPFLLVAIAILGARGGALSQEPRRAERIVFVIGDGMGLAQISAARFAKGSPLAWERAAVFGLQVTSSADKLVTDSAAAATALASGVKTKNEAIGVDADEKPLRGVLELAELRGMWTGLVATSSITHATPAAFAAHVAKRSHERAIAAQIASKEIEVLLGGGAQFFLPTAAAKAAAEDADGAETASAEAEDAVDPAPGIDLLEVMRAKGYAVLRTGDELDAFDPASSGRVLGLFSDSGMPSAGKRTPTLRAMTEKALALLDRAPQGFFLLVEGSQIDWRCHENDLRGAIAEVLDLSDAVEAIFAYADRRPDTLVVVTADHETGGLAIVGGDRARRTVQGAWPTKSHTATMVPVFAHGPAARAFGGVLENSEIGARLVGLVSDPVPSGG